MLDEIVNNLAKNELNAVQRRIPVFDEQAPKGIAIQHHLP
jgi:hypothetical protein